MSVADLAVVVGKAHVMEREVIGKAEPDAEILNFDVPDDALERAAGAEQRATTWIYCTNLWYGCGWPQ